MSRRPRSGSVNVVVGRSLRPSAAALVESLNAIPASNSKKAAALGKRKRGQSPTRSPSPTCSEPDARVKRARRSRSRTPAVRASTAPTTGAAANARILAALRARENVLTPSTHPRPSRQLFVWGNGDMGQFGLGTDSVCISFSLIFSELMSIGVHQLGDIVRPRLHIEIQDLSTKGSLGEPNAGLEAVACGGMHSLCIDELGRVC